jgi:hypothetical protein
MKKIFLLLTIYCLLFAINPVFAEETAKPTDYNLLAPLPGVETTSGSGKTTAGPYIQGIFTLMIAIAGGLAVLMIIFGGIKYMSTDAFAGKSEARATIEHAIWGLLLAMSAWLILYTVNPNLVGVIDLQVPVQPLATSTGPGPGGGFGIPMTAEEIAADKIVRDRLNDAGVGINAGPCLNGQGYGCTNLNGLAESAIQGLIVLKKDCGCVITVTGGTEPGPHKTHGIGSPIVDLSDNLNLRSWLTSKKFLITGSAGGVARLSSGRQAIFVFEKAGQGNSTGDHWHVGF